MRPCCASGVSDGDVHRDSRQASDRDRPCAALRISLNPVWSSIVQDLRLLPIDSSLVYLAVSEYISLSLCVFSGQVRASSHVNQQEHVKQQEAAKPCQIGKIVRFLHSKMLPFKKFGGGGGSTPINLLKARLKALNRQSQALASVGHCRSTPAARFLVCRKRKGKVEIVYFFEIVSLFISQWTLNVQESFPA